MIRRFSTSTLVIVGLLWLSGCAPLSGRANNNNGIGYFEQGEYTEAADEFRRAVADNPQNADYISNYATAMKKAGEMDKAEQSYLQALNLDPGHQPSYHGLASMYLETGQTDLAHNLMRSWVETQPYDPAAHVEMAWMHRETGNLAAAEEELRSALRINPNHPVAQAQLGQVYQDSGRSKEALAMYQSSLVGDWYQPELHRRVATITPPPGFAPNGPQYVNGPQPMMQPMTVQGPMISGPMLASPMTLSPEQAYAADPAHMHEITTLPEVQAH